MFPVQRSASARDIFPDAANSNPSRGASAAGSSASSHAAAPANELLAGLSLLRPRPASPSANLPAEQVSADEPVAPDLRRMLSPSERAEFLVGVAAWAAEGPASEKRADALARIVRYLDADSPENRRPLDLSGLSLSSLPPGLDRLDLRRLALGGNPIEDLDRLAELPSLSELHLNGMRLRQMPAGLDALTRLTVLDLSANPIEDLGRLAELPSLSDLHLNSMGLRQLPESLKALTRLTRLELICNPIEDLGGLDQLSSLRALRLDEMGLRRAPDSLRALTQLTNLGMSGNDLIEPPDLSACTQLKELGLARNQLALAPDLSAQTELSLLDLSDNQLAVPPDLGGCPNLSEILLWRNNLVAMPDLHRLERLISANLAHNQLSTLPPWIGNLPASLEVNLTGNPLDDASLAVMAQLPEDAWIVHERNPAVGGPPPPLHEQVRTWLAVNPEMPQDQREWLQERWRSFEQEPEADDFALLLHRMKHTADFQCGEATRRGLGRRIADTLVVLARDDALRARSFVTAQGGLGGCEDRVALTFSSIEVSTRAKALAGKPDELLKLGRGLHRLALVEQAALADMNARQGLFVDQVEVVLSYRVKLAEALDLPAQPARMGRHHALWARLNENQLDEMKQRVLNREKADFGALVASIASQPFWQESLQQQPTCAEEIAHLGAQREQQAEELEDTHKQAQERATKKERDDRDSDLNLRYGTRYGEITRRYDEGVQAIHRQFTRIALERVAAGESAFDTAPPPANVIAAAKIIDIAAQLQPPAREGQDAEARVLAGQLLEPRLLAALHRVPPSGMGPEEAKEMDAANARYMKLLEALAAKGLLDDPRLVFDRLMAGSVERREIPYLLHIASLIGTAHPYAPGVRMQLADAAVQLLARLAVQWAWKKPQAHSLMREALASQEHGASFYERGMGGSPNSLGAAAERLALRLSDANLMRTAELSGDQAKKSGAIAKKARKAALQSSGPPTQPRASAASASSAEKRSASLEATMRAFGELHVAGARATDARARARRDEAYDAQQAIDETRAPIAWAVRSEVDRQWEDMAKKAAKSLAPSLFGGFLNAEASAAYGEAVRSVPRTAPHELATRICDGLLSTRSGKDALASLTEKARDYKASEHPRFDSELRKRVSDEVQAALTSIVQGAGARAEAQVSAYAASDATERRARKDERRAERFANSSRVSRSGRRVSSNSRPAPRRSRCSTRSARSRTKRCN
jgi:Leucine-rich repeat (LRR) protein